MERWAGLPALPPPRTADDLLKFYFYGRRRLRCRVRAAEREAAGEGAFSSTRPVKRGASRGRRCHGRCVCVRAAFSAPAAVLAVVVDCEDDVTATRSAGFLIQ